MWVYAVVGGINTPATGAPNVYLGFDYSWNGSTWATLAQQQIVYGLGQTWLAYHVNVQVANIQNATAYIRAYFWGETPDAGIEDAVLVCSLYQR
jgi:hypothetical protein